MTATFCEKSGIYRVRTVNVTQKTEKWYRVAEVRAAARVLTRDRGYQEDLVQEMLTTLYCLCSIDNDLRRYYENQLGREVDDPEVQLQIARRRARHYLRDKLLDGSRSGSVAIVLPPNKIKKVLDRELSKMR